MAKEQKENEDGAKLEVKVQADDCIKVLCVYCSERECVGVLLVCGWNGCLVIVGFWTWFHEE